LGGVYFWTGKKRTYQISYQNDRGQEVRESARTTDEAAAAKLLQARRRAVIKAQELGEVFEAPKLRKQTISKCLDAWETQCKLQGRWNDCYATDLRQLKERFGSLTADALTKSRIQEYQMEQKAGLDEKKSLSRNCKLNRQTVILRHALKISGVTPSFAQQTKDLRLPEPPARQGYFSAQEFRILHSALPPDIADVIEFLWLSGWRLSECCGKVILKEYRPGILWSELSKDGSSITLPGQRSKNRESKQLPLVGELRTLIAKRAKLKVPGCDLIFHIAGRPVGEFRGAWRRACTLAGKPKGMIHDLRRSRAKIWGKAGVSEATAMRLGGWKTAEIYRRYNIIDENDLIRAQERTEKYLLDERSKDAEAKQISRAIN
jgi:integrase